MGEFSKKYSVRGIRGATTVESNSRDLIKDATKELLEDMVSKNEVLSEDILQFFLPQHQIFLMNFRLLPQEKWDGIPCR